MPNESSMSAGVLVRRAVATEGHPTFLAGAEMDPVGADLDALGAFQALGSFDRPDRIEMRTASFGPQNKYIGIRSRLTNSSMEVEFPLTWRAAASSSPSGRGLR